MRVTADYSLRAEPSRNLPEDRVRVVSARPRTAELLGNFLARRTALARKLKTASRVLWLCKIEIRIADLVGVVSCRGKPIFLRREDVRRAHASEVYLERDYQKAYSIYDG